MKTETLCAHEGCGYPIVETQLGPGVFSPGGWEHKDGHGWLHYAVPDRAAEEMLPAQIAKWQNGL